MTDPARSIVLPALPLKNNVLFPHLLLPLSVGRASSVAAVEAALLTEDKRLVIVAQRDALVEEPTIDDLFRIGTLAAIKKMERAESGLQIIVQGIERVELIEAVEKTPYFKLRVNPLAEPTDDGTEVEALGRAMLDQAAAVHALLQPDAPFTIQQMFAQVPDVLHQAYLLASMLNLDIAKSQAILEATTRADVLRQVMERLTHELQVLELRQKITSQAQSELSREQKEYLLRQQLRRFKKSWATQSRAGRRGRVAPPPGRGRPARERAQGSNARADEAGAFAHGGA